MRLKDKEVKNINMNNWWNKRLSEENRKNLCKYYNIPYPISDFNKQWLYEKDGKEEPDYLFN